MRINPRQLWVCNACAAVVMLASGDPLAVASAPDDTSKDGQLQEVVVAFRAVATDRYTSGWIDRVVIAPGEFPFPANYGACGVSYHCTRGIP
jgi:hypothetical protein